MSVVDVLFVVVGEIVVMDRQLFVDACCIRFDIFVYVFARFCDPDQSPN